MLLSGPKMCGEEGGGRGEGCMFNICGFGVQFVLRGLVYCQGLDGSDVMTMSVVEVVYWSAGCGMPKVRIMNSTSTGTSNSTSTSTSSSSSSSSTSTTGTRHRRRSSRRR